MEMMDNLSNIWASVISGIVNRPTSNKVWSVIQRFKIRGLVLKKTPDVVKASEISDFPIDRSDYYRDMVKDFSDSSRVYNLVVLSQLKVMDQTRLCSLLWNMTKFCLTVLSKVIDQMVVRTQWGSDQMFSEKCVQVLSEISVHRDLTLSISDNIRRYLNRKRETRKFLNNSIDNGLYVFKEIKPIENEDPRPETKDDLTVDACQTAHEMWLRVKHLMRGMVLNQVDKETRFNNEFDQFIAEPVESLVSSSRSSPAYYVTHPPSMAGYDDECDNRDLSRICEVVVHQGNVPTYYCVVPIGGYSYPISLWLQLDAMSPLIRKKFHWGTIFLIGLKRYRDPKEEPIEKEPLMELKGIG
ncbi:hypothetical protein Tco_0185220 [Tanacetum coccineum]